MTGVGSVAVVSAITRAADGREPPRNCWQSREPAMNDRDFMRQGRQILPGDTPLKASKTAR